MIFTTQSNANEPILFVSKADWAAIRTNAKHDETSRAIATIVLARANAQLNDPDVTHELKGKRLLSTSRQLLNYGLTFGAAYHLTGNERYARAAIRQGLAASTFPDWNPNHFLDVAEMTAGLAIILDWFDDALTEDERETLTQAIVNKGLRPGLGRYDWITSNNNWNSVCHGGLVIGALAVENEHPEIAEKIIDRAIANMPRVSVAYEPDGAYKEGPRYWGYGTTYHVLAAAALKHARGDAGGLDKMPGLRESTEYIQQMTSPTGYFYNYADNRASRKPSPALFWLAALLNDSNIKAWDMECIQAMASAPLPEHYLDANHTTFRVFPLALIWHRPDQEKGTLPVERKLAWYGRGVNPIAVMRTDWHDPDAAFVGFKGGSPISAHAHMDAGSFIYEVNGVRWVIDGDYQGYYSIESAGINLWDPSQDSKRWRVFTHGPEVHSILRFDNADQNVSGMATLTENEIEGAISSASADLTSLYPSMNEVSRDVALSENGLLRITDHWKTSNTSTNVTWHFCSYANAKISSDGVTLEQDGKRVQVRVTGSSSQVTWNVVDANTLLAPHDARVPGLVRIEASLTTPAEAQGHLQITMAPF